jgi:hypothetical protein
MTAMSTAERLANPHILESILGFRAKQLVGILIHE